MALQVKIKRVVTLPVLKLKRGVLRYFKFTGKMYTGEKLDDQKGPAEILPATDLETGEMGLVIAPTVLQKELAKHYPNDAYVGLCFQLMITKPQGKNYNIVSLFEIEPIEPPTFDPAAKAAQDVGSDAGEGGEESDEGEGGEESDEGEGGDAGEEADEGEDISTATPARNPAPAKPAGKKPAPRRR